MRARGCVCVCLLQSTSCSSLVQCMNLSASSCSLLVCLASGTLNLMERTLAPQCFSPSHHLSLLRPRQLRVAMCDMHARTKASLSFWVRGGLPTVAPPIFQSELPQPNQLLCGLPFGFGSFTGPFQLHGCGEGLLLRVSGLVFRFRFV